VGKFLNKYVRALYQNINKKIYIISLLFFAVLIIWVIIGKILGINTEKEEESENKTSYKPSETVISGKDITESVYEEDENIVEEFINYCNSGDLEKAYDMLSQDCKDIFYNTQEDFIKNYYNEVFETKREFNLQSWISESNYNTYRVRMIDDIMATGNYEDSKNYQDYITVVSDGDKKYLNINGFMYKKDINNVKKEVDGIEVSVKSVTTYIDYEAYTFSVKNNTDKTILMDNLENLSDTMYLELTSNKKRTSNAEGLSNIALTVYDNSTKEITVKYNKSAGASTDKDYKIHFLNVIKDYQEYINDKDNYSDILEITIKL
jgi:hypothetical protein